MSAWVINKSAVKAECSSSNSVRFGFERMIFLKIATLFVALCWKYYFKLKICLKWGILLRVVFERIRPKNSASGLLEPALEVVKLIWITKDFLNQYSYLRSALHEERAYELRKIWASFLASIDSKIRLFRPYYHVYYLLPRRAFLMLEEVVLISCRGFMVFNLPVTIYFR